jgi:hypothetical protein
MARFKDPLMQPFKFPKGVLNQVSECSPRGYILFYIDYKGSPQISADFNSHTEEIALRAHAGKILDSINQVEGCDMAENIFRKLKDDNEEE